ncbi:MAG: TIGR02452 family protein, partial [Nannocystaceae bacterium]
MANKIRERRSTVSHQTLEILERGYYAAPDGGVQSIAVAQREAVAGSRHYRPEQLEPIETAVRSQKRPARDIRFEVTNETTLAAASRLVARGIKDPMCLNFASARNPGGGFIKGSSGQEESLARSSGLYPCLAQMEAMYRINRSNRSLLYS